MQQRRLLSLTRVKTHAITFGSVPCDIALMLCFHYYYTMELEDSSFA